jgi:hypothetical protein
MTLRTDPPGARVFARPFAAADTAWTLVGKTPIDSLLFVRGTFIVKIEKGGYEPTYDLFWNGFYDEQNRRYQLKRSDQIPRGMVWVPGQAPRVRSDGVSEGVHMPGIEHLAPQELGDFFVDRYEVTNKDYKQFVDGGGYGDPSFWKEPFFENGKTVKWKDAVARFTDKTQRPGPAGWEVGDYPDGTDRYPVTGVSWYEAAAFAEFAGKQLPTIYHWDRVALTWASGDIVTTSRRGGGRGQNPGDESLRRLRPGRKCARVVRQRDQPRRPLHLGRGMERPAVFVQRRVRPIAVGPVGDQRLPLHSLHR